MLRIRVELVWVLRRDNIAFIDEERRCKSDVRRKHKIRAMGVNTVVRWKRLTFAAHFCAHKSRARRV
jgi:hypothetical protein